MISVRKHTEFDCFKFRATFKRALAHHYALAWDHHFFEIGAALERCLGDFGESGRKNYSLEICVVPEALLVNEHDVLVFGDDALFSAVVVIERVVDDSVIVTHHDLEFFAQTSAACLCLDVRRAFRLCGDVAEIVDFNDRRVG